MYKLLATATSTMLFWSLNLLKSIHPYILHLPRHIHNKPQKQVARNPSLAPNITRNKSSRPSLDKLGNPHKPIQLTRLSKNRRLRVVIRNVLYIYLPKVLCPIRHLQKSGV